MLSNINDAGEAARRGKNRKRKSLLQMIIMKLIGMGSWKDTPRTTKKLAKICVRIVDEIYLHESPDSSDPNLSIKLLNTLKKPLGISRALDFSIWLDERLAALKDAKVQIT